MAERTLPRVSEQLRGTRCLVFGAGGFIGSHIVEHLVAAGACVGAATKGARVAGRRSERLPVEWIGGVDVTEKAAVFGVMERFQPAIVFNLAAAGVVGDATLELLTAVNGLGAYNIATACSEQDIQRLVHVGSGFEYEISDEAIAETFRVGGTSKYGVSKCYGSLLVELAGYTSKLAVTVLRLFSTYGPRESPRRLIPHVISKALAGEPVRLTAGNQRRDYTFVGDISEGIVRAAVSPHAAGEIFNLGNTEVCTVAEIVGSVVRVMEGLGVAANVEVQFGAVQSRTTDRPVFSADPRKAHALLGWQASTNLEHGLLKTVRYFLEEESSGRIK